MKFAAIDIGSNAVRLLFSNVLRDSGTHVSFKKDSLIRVPLRLGDDAFVKGSISVEKSQNLIKTMIAFRHLIDVFKPIDFMACATSAMREASNAQELIKEVKKQTGIEISIIDGKTEAELIYNNDITDDLPKDHSYLYIDVGGGSTELTLYSNGQRIKSNSFNIGTIRMLDHTVQPSEWDRLEQWIIEHTKKFHPLDAIGSGGNINKIFKLSARKEGKPISLKKIKEIYHFISQHTIEERISVLDMKPDRADVIIPASEIYMTIMKWAHIQEIHVPQIGLADGIVHVLYKRYMEALTTI